MLPIDDRDPSICCHGNHHKFPESISTCKQLCQSLNKRKSLADICPCFSLFPLYLCSPILIPHPNKPLSHETILAWCGLFKSEMHSITIFVLKTMLSIDWYWQGSLDNHYELTATVTASTDSATTTSQAPQGSSLQPCQSPTIAFTTAIQLPLPATVGLTDFQQVSYSCYHGTYRFLQHELLLPSSTWRASFCHVGYSVRQAHTNPSSGPLMFLLFNKM